MSPPRPDIPEVAGVKMSRTLLTRLLPAVIVIPVLVGWLRLEGEKAGLYGTEFGVALMVLSTVVLLSICVWWTAHLLHRADIERSAIEHALRTSEERARVVIETAHDAFVAMDANGTIIDWNPQAEKIFDLPASQAIGRRLSDTIMPERYRRDHEIGLAQFLKTGEGPLLKKGVEITAVRADGSEFPVELSISPIRWADTWIFNAFIHEMTERKATDVAEAPGAGAPQGSGLRILLVEDHATTRATLVRLLQAWGHTVEEAGSLADARQILTSGDVDLLLTDVQLPDGLGSDLMREIRQTSPEAPGIALTGFDAAGYVNESFQAGFMLHFTKPIATEKLRTALDEIARAQQRV